MNENVIAKHFARMSARIKFVHWETTIRLRMFSAPDYALDICSDNRGRYFELRIPDTLKPHLKVEVLQVQPAERHLLLLVRKPREKDRFLCGHDKREWFVAAVPGRATSITQAKDALKPEEVRVVEDRSALKGAQRDRRRNRAFVRQGEWFFVSEPSLNMDSRAILHNEPIRRGRGKPHFATELYRCGGVEVFGCGRYPNGISEVTYRELKSQKIRQ